jgi:3-oxoacyl-[acyl-carrier-protein] synthase-3
MQRCRIESLGVSLPRSGLFKWGSMKHAVEAGRRCLESSHYLPQDVRVLINTGVHRDGHVCEPAIAAYIQHQLGINIEFQGRRTLSFDLLNGGCGMLNAAQVLSALMLSGEIQAGMVVSSEADSDRHPDPAYVWPASGAAVMLDLSPRSSVGFGAFAFHTREKDAELLTSVVSLEKAGGHLIPRRDPRVERLWLESAGAAVDEALERDGLRREEIDVVVPSQIGSAFLDQLPEAIGLAPEKIARFDSELPDTLSTSVFLALRRTLDTRPPKPGEKALLMAFGSGLTVAAATYHF